MSPAEARALFMAAVAVVAPEAGYSIATPPVGSVGGLIAWLADTDVTAMLARLSDSEREDLLLILGGMLRELARAS